MRSIAERTEARQSNPAVQRTRCTRREREAPVTRHLNLTAVLALALCTVPLVAGKKERKKVPELAKVNTLFVAGNSQAADKAREMVRESKTCFALALKRGEADAVLELNDSSTASTGLMGGLGQKHSTVSGTVTLKTGELIWSDSQRFSDAPLMSGSKTAAKLLIDDLATAADCKARKKK